MSKTCFYLVSWISIHFQNLILCASFVDRFYVKNVNALDFIKTKYQESRMLRLMKWNISIVHSQCEKQYGIYSLNTWKVSHYISYAFMCHNKLKWNEKLGHLRLDFVWLHWFDFKEESKEMHRRWKYKWQNKTTLYRIKDEERKQKQRRICAQNELTTKKILNIHLVRSRVVLMPSWNSIGVIFQHVIHRFSFSLNNTIW